MRGADCGGPAACLCPETLGLWVEREHGLGQGRALSHQAFWTLTGNPPPTPARAGLPGLHPRSCSEGEGFSARWSCTGPVFIGPTRVRGLPRYCPGSGGNEAHGVMGQVACKGSAREGGRALPALWGQAAASGVLSWRERHSPFPSGSRIASARRGSPSWGAAGDSQAPRCGWCAVESCVERGLQKV